MTMTVSQREAVIAALAKMELALLAWDEAAKVLDVADLHLGADSPRPALKEAIAEAKDALKQVKR
jgi:hypothetical protein